MPFTYDKGLCLLAVGVAMFGAFTALVMTADMHRGRQPAQTLRLFVAALSLGLGAFAMQMIAILAIRLPVRLGYDGMLVAAAGALPTVGAAVAFFLCAVPPLRAGRVVAGAAALAAGLGGMHYLAVQALSGALTAQVSATGVVISIVLAFVAGLLTIAVTFRPRGVFMAFLGAAVIGLAISAVHFAPMQTTAFTAVRNLAGFPVPEFSEIFLAWTAAVMVYLFGSVCLAVYALFQFVGERPA
jgi:NO-binding membrane sensor protein with MHYT domain